MHHDSALSKGAWSSIARVVIRRSQEEPSLVTVVVMSNWHAAASQQHESNSALELFYNVEPKVLEFWIQTITSQVQVVKPSLLRWICSIGTRLVTGTYRF